jgi:glycosyltransferase involved in cell wall biosynthesis
MSKMNKNLKNLKVALVHEELTQLGGAERVLDVLIELFPSAPIYTIVYNEQKTSGKYAAKDIRTSFIQKMPFGSKKYKWYLPLMPKAVEKLDFSEFDLVISDASALIKGIKTNKNQLHICYCHTPTRYLWTDSASYIKTAPIPFFVRPLMPIVINYLRKWDLKASKRPDYFIANSFNVKNRIKKYYNRDSFVLFPPLEGKKFPLKKEKKDYYLLVSRIEPYKKVDMVIDAFKKLDLNLKIAGSGTKINDFKKTATKNIEFLGRISDEDLAKYYQNAKALIFPQEEDAGITPLEAMSCGSPVIAYKKGGALESIIENKTGLFFTSQNAGSLSDAIKSFEKKKFDVQAIHNHAQKFDKVLFKKKILEYINSKLN